MFTKYSLIIRPWHWVALTAHDSFVIEHNFIVLTGNLIWGRACCGWLCHIWFCLLTFPHLPFFFFTYSFSYCLTANLIIIADTKFGKSVIQISVRGKISKHRKPVFMRSSSHALHWDNNSCLTLDEKNSQTNRRQTKMWKYMSNLWCANDTHKMSCAITRGCFCPPNLKEFHCLSR